MPQQNPDSFSKSAILMTCRLIAGGALMLAGIIKLRDPSTFMLSIESFHLLPQAIIPFAAYALPWSEIIGGLLLLYGFWTRSAALVATGLYTIFILALVWVLWKDLPVDCGCFGGLFGSETVGFASILRNIVFVSAAITIVYFGGGAASLDFIRQRNQQPTPATEETETNVMAGQRAS